MDTSIPAGARILLDFIGNTEAPQGYDTVYGNNQGKMPKPLTRMTFDEVVADGPRRTKAYGSSAAGHYQFMRDTLDAPKTAADIKGEMGLSGDELFDPDLQDRMGFHLLKRRGYEKFAAGRIGVPAFGLALAQEWASFPVLRAVKGAHRKVARGETYYAGDALNKALVRPERIEALLAQVLAAGGAVPATEAPAAGPKAAVRKPVVRAGAWAEQSLAPFEIRGVQTRLIALGFNDVGLVDGVWKPDGKVSTAVRQLQARAVALGDKVSIDGHYGPETQDLLNEKHGDRYRAVISEQRANTTAADLARAGTPAVVQGRKITWSSAGSIVMAIGAFAVALIQGWQAKPDVPWYGNLVAGFLPPWAAPVLVVLFNLYSVAKSQGIIASSVERFREGIDNTGLPPAASPGGLLGSLFGGRSALR